MVEHARAADPAVPPADRSMLLAFVGAARELIAAHLLNHEAESLVELEDPIVTVAERLLLGR